MNATMEKPFKFQITVDAHPTNNPPWPEYTHAAEIASDMITAAIMNTLNSKMIFISQNKIQDVKSLTGRDKDYWEWLDQKQKLYEKIRRSLTPT
jgi:hypothetical protein